MTEHGSKFPPKPDKPLDSDCCGQGCDPCILDIYQQELEIWEAECNRIRNGDVGQTQGEDKSLKDAGPVIFQSEYKTFVIQETFYETHDCKRYRFTVPADYDLGLSPGQHVVIRTEICGEVVTRQYTPVSDVRKKGSFDLLAKVYEDGKMSHFIKQWTVGTHIQMRGPCGLYRYQPNQYRVLYLFAVGTGIAPMAQVIQSILNNEEDETLLQLHFGCRTYSDIPLKAWIDDWSRYWNFSCQFYLSQEPSVDCQKYRYGDKIYRTRITEEVVQSVIDTNIQNTFVLICGTKSFEKDMIQFLSNLGLSAQRFHKF